MLLPTTIVLAAVIQFLPHFTIQSCISATKDRCSKAGFAPGSNLAGEGFDITTMKNKGAFVIDMDTWETPNQTCTLCTNPYFGGQEQKLPRAVGNWRPRHKCNMALKSEMLASALSVAEHVSKSVENNWKIGLGLSKMGIGGSLSLSGTHSKLAMTAMEKSKQDHFNFVSHSVKCGFYSYKISRNAKLHPDFKHDLDKLPETYGYSTKEAYGAFIDTYGTHVIVKVQAGGKVESITSIRECEASMMGLSSDEIRMCLGAEVAATIPAKVDVDLNVKANFCNGKKQKSNGGRSFSNRFHDRITEITGGQTTESELLFSTDASAYKKWLKSLPASPDVISYALKPLYKLIPKENAVAKRVKNAIREYIVSRGVKKECSNQCKVGRRISLSSCTCHCQNHKFLGPNCCPARSGLASVILTILNGKNLYGDTGSGTDGYVKIYDKDNILLGKTNTINNNNYPEWNMEFNFDLLLSANSKLRIEVWDEDNKYDDLLGTCLVKLRSGTKGKKICSLNYGHIFYRLKVICGSNLSGPSCSKYANSPMDSQVEKLYVSRHGRPIPKHILSQMGMQLNRQAFNYTFTGQSSVQKGGKANRL